MIPMETKTPDERAAARADRAAKMLAFITENVNAGRTVYAATALKVTKIQKKHLAQVRVRNGALEVQHGSKWLDYSYTKLTAQ